MTLLEVTVAKIDELNAKVDALQASVDTKQQAIADAIAALKAQIGGASDEALQAVIDKLSATQADVESTPTE